MHKLIVIGRVAIAWYGWRSRLGFGYGRNPDKRGSGTFYFGVGKAMW